MTKTIYGLILFCLIALILSSCGIQDVAEKTHSAVEASNAKQDELLEYIRRTEALTQKLKELNVLIEHGIHLQTLSTALEGMLDPENSEILNPPLKMMPYAKVFATEATEDEIIETAHFLLQETLISPIAKSRITAFMAMSAISAFTSRDKLKLILQNQIENEGFYQETTYVFATARNDFIRDYLFRPLIESATFHNKATLKMGVEYFLDLKHLAQVSYVNDLNMNIPTIEVQSQIDPTELPSIAQQGLRLYQQKLSEKDLNDKEVIDLLAHFEQVA